MSLLGRLEDLPLTDIVQIVFLSRRTGILEIIDSVGRHTVLFQQGLIVNASSPYSPDLSSYIRKEGLVDARSLQILDQTEKTGIIVGTALLEMNLMSQATLSEVILRRITDIVTPLMASRDGEFNFILSDSLGERDLDYNVEQLFPEGGIAPQKVLGTEGDKIKPLQGLEESMRAGKNLLRGRAVSTTHLSTDGFELNLKGAPIPGAQAATPPQSPPVPSPRDGHSADERGMNVSPTPPQPEPASDSAPVRKPGPVSRFKIAGDTADPGKTVVLFERDALIRVAARRAFAKSGINVLQFWSFDESRKAIQDLLRKNSFFVSFFELNSIPGNETQLSQISQLIQIVKRRNRKLPFVVVDREADLRRRHHLLKDGADLYLTKPDEAHLQPGMVEEGLALFADELVLYAQRAFHSNTPESAGEKELEDDKVVRGFGLLKQLIHELNNPNDIRELLWTILRLAGEYVERGVLFCVSSGEFVGLGGFGPTADGVAMDERVQRIRVPRGEPSVLGDVADSRISHHGKLKRTRQNEMLIGDLGVLLPTQVVVLPIMNRDKVVGVLYGDNGGNRSDMGDTTGLEIFLSQAGFALENALIASARKAEN